MGLALAVLGWLGVLVLAGFVLLVVTPLHLRITGHAGADWSGRATLVFLGGLAPAITVYDSRRPRQASPTAPKAKRAHKWRPRVRTMRAIPRLIRGFLSAVKLHRLDVSGRFGLPDPADTGMLYGWFAPLIQVAQRIRKIEVEVAPDFSGAILEGRVEADLRLIPLSLVSPALRFAVDAFGPER